MVIRYGNYEMTEYLKQLKNKKLKRLVPQVMIVFYTGDKKWNTPLELNDYFDIPEELKEYVNDWKIKAVDVKEIDTSKIKDEQTRRLHRRIKMNKDNFIYAAIITGSLDLIRDLPEGDEIDICEKREKKTVLSLLKVKLGNVSNQLEQAIPNSSIEKLNTLTLSIFAITNEDDVLKIIN